MINSRKKNWKDLKVKNQELFPVDLFWLHKHDNEESGYFGGIQLWRPRGKNSNIMCSFNHVFLRFLSCRNLLCSGITLLPLLDCMVKVCSVLSFLPVSIGPSVILNKKTIQYIETIQYIWNKNNDVHVPRGKNPYFNTRIHISSFDLDNYGSLKGSQLDIKLLHYTTTLFLQI